MSIIRSTPASANRRPTARGDAGTGLIGTVAGVSIFLLFLLFSVHVRVRLYATSAMTSAAFDAARRVASADAVSRPLAVRQAEADPRRALGSFGRDHTTFTWLAVDGDSVVLEVRGRPPSFLPVSGWLGVIDRTVRVRTERFR
jgi:hypothetical protein